MSEATAIEVAVGLHQLPSRARALREGRLPPDLDVLLRIVAGDDRVLADTLSTTKLSQSVVQAAASFYVEQIMLHPDGDSYRALGASPEATIDELRRNMALLLRWLHPDREANSERSIYAGRVTEAWNNVKTAKRRAIYDETRKQAANGKPVVRSHHERSRLRAYGDVRLLRNGSRRQAPSLWRRLGRLFGRP